MGVAGVRAFGAACAVCAAASASRSFCSSDGASPPANFFPYSLNCSCVVSGSAVGVVGGAAAGALAAVLAAVSATTGAAVAAVFAVPVS